ncbi:MAG TPA: hypothetical protein VJ890_00395 [Vineibacter sp.]|nr:hypothetical protein [Vineibacter sp.]
MLFIVVSRSPRLRCSGQSAGAVIRAEIPISRHFIRRSYGGGGIVTSPQRREVEARDPARDVLKRSGIGIRGHCRLARIVAASSNTDRLWLEHHDSSDFRIGRSDRGAHRAAQHIGRAAQ